jgi:hypothetical protein
MVQLGSGPARLNPVCLLDEDGTGKPTIKDVRRAVTPGV